MPYYQLSHSILIAEGPPCYIINGRDQSFVILISQSLQNTDEAKKPFV